MRKAFLAALLLLFVAPAWADFEMKSATSAVYLVQERDDDGQVIKEQEVTVSEGIEFSSDRAPVGFIIGVVALEDEGESLPRLAPMGAVSLGGQTFRWSLGVLYDRQNVDEEVRVLTAGTVRF